MSRTPEDEQLLQQYVTDTEGDIFAIHNLHGIVGAVFARYSRAKGSFRDTLLKEFVKEGNIDPKLADKLIERVLIAYGDDSVGELEGAHMAFENISMLATKEIEDRRIGGSPIEKSTRYVFFDEKDEEGKYRYLRPTEVMASVYAHDYEQVLDFVFNTYSEAVPTLQAFYKERHPLDTAEYDILGTGTKQLYSELTEEKDQKAFMMTYNADQRTRACDALRCLLPLSTKTNVGVFGNGRFFQMLISHLLSSPSEEVRTIGEKTLRELSKIMPQYVRRAAPKTYTMEVEKNMASLAKEVLRNVMPQAAERVTIPPLAERNSESFLLANMLYPYSTLPFAQIYRFVDMLKPELRERIKATYVGERKTRRDRPGRALESGYTYTMDLFADYGTYKDLERHRMGSQMRQAFSPLHGFIVPDDIAAAGLTEKVLTCHEAIEDLYKKLLSVVPEAASYVTLHGHRVRWLMSMNDRALMHMLELRTTKQGHPQYRKLCQEIHKAVEQIDPWRAKIMNFVDHNDYTSARGDSEARQRIKERELEEKKP